MSLGLLVACQSTEESSDHNQHPTEAKDSLAADSIQTGLSSGDFNELNGIQFGFSNEEGTEVIWSGELGHYHTNDFTKTIDQNGDLESIKYDYLQEANENDTHRQTPYNFENAEGYVYRVEGKIDPWASAILFTDDFLAQRKLVLPVPGKNYMFTQEDAEKVEEEKGRYIKRIEHLKLYTNGMSTHFVQFENKGDSVLVALVFRDTKGEFMYIDFPAEYNEMSTWRVDDGGEFDFQSYKVRALIEAPGGLEVITDWYGAEGTNVSYIGWDGEKMAIKKSGYLYQAPL